MKVAIDAWTNAVAIAEGHVFRSVNRAGKALDAALSEKAVWQLLRPYGCGGRSRHCAS